MKLRIINYVIFLVIFVLLITPVSAKVLENITVYETISDKFTFETKGNFYRETSRWFSHNDINHESQITIRKLFNVSKEQHNINSNISYLFCCKNEPIRYTKKPENDFTENEIIMRPNITHDEAFLVKRSYDGSFNESQGDRMNVGYRILNKFINNCNNNRTCSKYKTNYRTIIRFPESKLFGTKKLSVKIHGSQPDEIYKHGKYRVYMWKSFTLASNDMRYRDVELEYSYDLSSGFKFMVIGAFLGVFLTPGLKRIWKPIKNLFESKKQ